MEIEKNKWWGYLHIHGTIQVKRYFDKRDIEEARTSPFVQQIFYEFEANTRDEAIEHVKKLI